MVKKISALFLAVVMVLSMISVVVSAYSVGPDIADGVNYKYTVEKVDTVPETAAGSEEWTADNIYAVSVWMKASMGVDALTAPIHFDKTLFSPIMLSDGEVTYPHGAGFGVDDYYENMGEGVLYAYAEGDYLLNTGMYKADGSTATSKALAKCIGLGNENSAGVTITAELVSPDHPLYSKWGAGLPANAGVMYVNLDVAGSAKSAYLNTIEGINYSTDWNKMFTVYFETITDADVSGAKFGVFTDDCFTVDANFDATGAGYFVGTSSYQALRPATNIVSNAFIGGAAPACTHENVTWTITTPATCTDAGEETGVCADCGEVMGTRPVNAPGHKYDSAVTAPTCTEDGYTTYTCPACGDTYTADEVPATGHSYKEKVTQPTCTRKGSVKYTCDCGDTYTEEIPALNHTNPDGTSALETIPAVEPTCTVQGYTEGKLCTICNAQAVVPQGIPATGHTKDPNNAVVTAPTYTSQGYTTYTCPVCGDTFVDEYVPALTVEFTFEIAAPSVTTLRAKDTIILHPVFTGEVAEGVTVEWTADNENFKVVEVYEDGSVKVQAKKVVKGTDGVTTFTATAVDAEGNEITSDTVELTANAKFFQQFLGFFRTIFGLAKHYEA